MAFLIIDGYNVTGIRHADLEAARRAFISDLISYSKARGHEITVVFDGWRGGAGREARSVQGGVKVIYSPLGQKADSLIGRLIASDDRQWIVISSDREVQSRAWAADCVPIDSDLFLSALEGAARGADTGEAAGEDEAEDFTADFPRRGNPRRPSKKQKAIDRALRKL